MLKNEIRKLFLQKRKSLSEEEVSELNLEIEHLFSELLTDNIKTVHIYLPIQTQQEIDTWSIIRNLWKSDIRVVVPVVNENLISSKLLSAGSALTINKWGVPEPLKSENIDDGEIDLVLVPLLAFDKNGHRVGYGKGYYDRFLASLKQKPIKVGLSFFSPITNITDKDSWDIPLDYCITPELVFRF